MSTSKTRLLLGLALLLALLAACAHTDRSGEGASKVEGGVDKATEFRLPPYPEARRMEDFSEILHGYTVRDPYRWMEEEGAADGWIEKENAYSRTYFDGLNFPGLEKRVTELFSIGYISDPRMADGRLFYLKRETEGQEQAVLVVSINGGEKVLVDPNMLDKDFKTAIDWFHPSDDGKLVAYGLSRDGSEDSVLYVLDVDNMKQLSDVIPDTRHSSIEWKRDNSGFYYTRYPKGGRYDRKAYYHALGDDPANDELVFGEKKSKFDWTHLKLSDDGRHLMVSEYQGWTNTDLYLYDTKTKKIKPLVIGKGAAFMSLDMTGGVIYGVTNLEAPNWRFVAIDPKKPAPKRWKTIIKEGEWPIEFSKTIGDKVLIKKLENVSSRLYIYGLKDGKALGEIPLPDIGMVSSLDADPVTKRIAFTFISFFYPSRLYQVDSSAKTPEPELIARVEADIRPDDFTVKQIQYPSYDGTKVNMFVVHKKGLAIGPRPTLLYGYGGFLVNMEPYFSRRIMFWIERGGVYAVANIRGGGEYGESWHKGGMLGKKFQCFKDFEYAMRHLIRSGYTDPRHLVIEGGSNGGLLVGAMMTSVPHLFGAALGSVGLYDMIRYQRFPPGEIWTPEYGSSDKAEDIGYLLGYSPYHQVATGVDYPAFYGDTADTDTRVHWIHTAKFTAALQHASTSEKPILFFLEKRAGHGAGKTKSDVTKEYIDKFKFMLSNVGDPADFAK